MTNLKIDWWRKYPGGGTGWSVEIDGIWVVTFERWLIVALWKSFWAYRKQNDDCTM